MPKKSKVFFDEADWWIHGIDAIKSLFEVYENEIIKLTDREQ